MFHNPEAHADPGGHRHVIARVRAEYEEMLGLRLTLEQARRLFGLDGSFCFLVLSFLVQSGFLYVGSDGQYARSTTDGISRGPTKTTLRRRSR